jgi:Zn-dependent protease
MSRDLQIVVQGIPVRAGWLWLVVTTIMIAITANALAPPSSTRSDAVLWYLGAALVVIGSAASLMLHEFAHARAAKVTGGRVHVITPPMFGALTDDAYPPDNPRADALVSVAGPITSLTMGLVLGTLWLLLRGHVTTIATLIGCIAISNLILAAANFMPGFPLDGGRLFRAFVWYLTDDLVIGTRFASVYGNFIALVGLITGLVLLSLGEPLSLWGAWALLAFWTINREGREGYLRTVWREASKSLSIEDAGLANSRRIDANRTIDDALDDLLQGIVDGPMLVADDGQVIGIVSLADIRKVPRAIWTERSLRDVTRPLTNAPRIGSDQRLLALVQMFESTRADIILVETRGRLTGAVDQETTFARVRARIREERMDRQRRRS